MKMTIRAYENMLFSSLWEQTNKHNMFDNKVCKYY